MSRDTRNVYLTADGERLLGPARTVVAQADALIARFRDPRSPVRCGSAAQRDFASAYLPDILGIFAAAHPAVELHVHLSADVALIEELQAGTQDLIIVKQDPDHPYPKARPLWREPLVWVATPALAAEGPPAPGNRPLPLVLSPQPCVYRGPADTRA